MQIKNTNVPDTMYTGRCLRRARKSVGITYRNLAEHFGISCGDMISLENGNKTIPEKILIQLLREGLWGVKK